MRPMSAWCRLKLSNSPETVPFQKNRTTMRAWLADSARSQNRVPSGSGTTPPYTGRPSFSACRKSAILCRCPSSCAGSVITPVEPPDANSRKMSSTGDGRSVQNTTVVSPMTRRCFARCGPSSKALSEVTYRNATDSETGALKLWLLA